MNKQLNALFSVLIKALTALTVMVLAFVIYFIVKEALPTFDEVAVPDFLLGRRWMPIAYTGEPSFGIFNFIAATLYVSLVAMVLAVSSGGGGRHLSFLCCHPADAGNPISLCGPFSRNPIRDIWLHGADPYGQAFHQGRSPHRLLRAGGRNPAGRYAASISDILLQ